MTQKRGFLQKLKQLGNPHAKDAGESPFMESLFKGLLSSWKQPDGARKAHEALEEMDYPSFSSVLPYRYYDADSGLFINKETAGFVLECAPLIGANDKIVDALDYFLRNKLPRKTPLTFLLLGSKCISGMLDYGLRDFSWDGELASKFNAITRAYYENGAMNGLANKQGLPLTLRNYRLFVIYAEPVKRADALTLQNLNQTLSVVQQSLLGASIGSERLDDKGLIKLVREMVNFRHHNIAEPSDEIEPYEELNAQCVDRSFVMELKPEAMHQSLMDEKGKKSHTRILNYSLAKTRSGLHSGKGAIISAIYLTLRLPCHARLPLR